MCYEFVYKFLNKFVMERFIETIKVLDGQFYNLEAHERRARATAEAFSGSLSRGRSGGWLFRPRCVPGW